MASVTISTRNVVYALFDIRKPELVRYVGLTSKRLNNRVAGHRSAARTGKTWAVAEWITEIGVVNLGYKVLEECEHKASLGFYEEFWIAKMRVDGFPLLNQTTGGEHPVFSEEVLLKRKWNYRKPVFTPEARASWIATLSDGRQKGENHNGAKLTELAVLEIRERLSLGTLGTVLASEFGVSHATIMDIKKRRSWTHI